VITLESNRHPGLLGGLASEFAVLFNGAGVGESSLALSQANNIATLDVDTNLVNGQTCEFTYTAGTLTSNYAAGWGSTYGSAAAVRTFTAASGTCTNNVGAGAPSYAFEQVSYQFVHAENAVSAPVTIAAADTAIVARPGAYFAVKSVIGCNLADCPAIAVIPYYDVNLSDTWEPVPDAATTKALEYYGTANLVPGIPAQGTLVEGGTLDGLVVRSSVTIPTFDLGSGGDIYNIHIFRFTTSATVTDVYRIRFQQQGGAVLDTYTAMPTATIVRPRYTR
jgi:hypothetical protein